MATAKRKVYTLRELAECFRDMLSVPHGKFRFRWHLPSEDRALERELLRRLNAALEPQLRP